MTPTAPAFDLRELLSLIPYQLGYMPEESLVIATVRGTGPGAWLESVTRTDPGPEAISPAGLDEMAGGPGHLVLVVYTADPGRAATLAGTLAQARPGATIATLTGDHWEQTHPVRRRELVAELDETVAAARMRLRGETYLRRRSDVAPPVASPVARAIALSAANQAAISLEPQGDIEEILAAAVGPAPDPATLGRLAVELNDDAIVLAILMRLLAETGFVPDTLVEVGQRLLDVDAGPPPSALVAELEDLATTIAAAAPADLKAGPLGLSAVLGWWSARHPQRAAWRAQSAAAGPHPAVADLAADLFSLREVPGWVVRRNATN